MSMCAELQFVTFPGWRGIDGAAESETEAHVGGKLHGD